jgi:NADP-dependent 3-hydroxy acid dehydrogenase YdfG
VTRGVVVTGASSGIGRACSLDLHRRGFRVSQNVERMRRLVQIAQRTGAKPERVAIDRLLPTRLGDRVMARFAGS